ncbi:ATP-binding cassette domain-containing protein [Kibdelosporangium aridum]|uniref:ATP-binding cassette domain-containing protein n=1 Tax=Kibdelosporangium aridum TaxID=2030 RepID=UPI0035EF86E7
MKAAGAEAREIAAVERSTENAWRAGVRSAWWESLVHGSNGLAVQASFLAVLGIGGARVATGAIPLSTLVAFLLFLFYLHEPIGQLLHAGSRLQVGLAAVRRLGEVDQMPAEPVSTGGTEVAGQGAARLAFENVRFRYGPDLPEVLRGVSVDVPALGMTAFVGPSGAGKSTLFALIERFHEPDSGRIRLDGRDLADWDLAGLRAGIGYVEQDARPCCPGRCARTSSTAARRRLKRRFATWWRRRGLTRSSSGCPTGWTQRSGIAATSCPAVSGNGSRLLVR